MRRLTVLQVLPALDAGGVERSTLEIAQALVEAGHRALVVSAGGRLVPRLEALGATHITLDVGRKSLVTLGRIGALRRLLRAERPDIVHVRSRLPAWIARMALRGIPVAQRPRFVTTVHGLNSPSRYSAVMARGERVICVSGTVRDHVLKHYPDTDAACLRVIPRGIDAGQFPRRSGVDRAARAALAAAHPQLGGAGPLLLMPGRGTRLKGHQDAIALLVALRATGVDARLWMPGALQTGRDDYLLELETQLHCNDAEDAVAITEPTEAIAQAYAASDLVLQLSRKPEAFGRTVLEALSVGVPVVGWDHGGVGELLQALQQDGAVPIGDAVGLREAALCALAQPPSPPATIPYSLNAMQAATLAVYDELIR